MIGDHYSQQWVRPGQWQQEAGGTTPIILTSIDQISRQEFEELKREVLTMKELLIKAKAYDEKNGEPNCEMEEKVKILKKVADLVGVSLEEIFKK